MNFSVYFTTFKRSAVKEGIWFRGIFWVSTIFLAQKKFKDIRVLESFPNLSTFKFNLAYQIKR